MHGGSPGGVTGRTTPSSIKYPSNIRPSSRTRSAQSGRLRSESPMIGSPDRSASRGRDSSNFRRREPSSSPSMNKGHHHYQQDSEGEGVCNYDTNVTTLYELLESSNWEKAKSRCRSHPHEVRTWIVRRDSISQKVRWKLLPLHAAVIFQSPTFVVSALIENYPAAVSRRDDQGMLPLHLAFRYKEDNEDLLELLLMQYPKGVLMKDKRDRTPLEHGRGSKFSAKVMRMYADAAVAGSRALTMGSGGTSDNFDVQKAGDSNEVFAEYENKTNTLKSMYEDRIKTLQDQHRSDVNQLRISHDEERRRLINVHMEEMETMRNMLNSHGGGDPHMIADLESEMNQLRTELANAKEEKDSANLHLTDVKSYADDLALQLRRLLQDQETLQLMVSQQQTELDKAQTRREQLIQNLLRQEQEERPTRVRRGTEIKELISTGRSSMQSLLAREPVKSSPAKPSPHHHHHHHTSSRLRATGHPAVTATPPSPSPHEKSPHNTYFTTTGPSTTAIKDDISAITENSNF